MFDITISIVTFNNSCETLKKTLRSCCAAKLKIKLCIVDNSNSTHFKSLCDEMHIEYLSNSKNIGFGAAHNIAIKKHADNSRYYLILNPDVYFEENVLESMYHFAEISQDIGLIMPRILLPDNSLQYMCKLLPNPFDFALRRFIPLLPTLLGFLKKRDDLYVLRNADYDQIMDVPFLSGCFMFIRSEAFKKIGFFDERFFMYLEDVDFCRRIQNFYRTVYFPNVSIVHECERGSLKNAKLLRYHIISAIRYFNKWGWFFDKERTRINSRTTQQLHVS